MNFHFVFSVVFILVFLMGCSAPETRKEPAPKTVQEGPPNLNDLTWRINHSTFTQTLLDLKKGPNEYKGKTSDEWTALEATTLYLIFQYLANFESKYSRSLGRVQASGSVWYLDPQIVDDAALVAFTMEQYCLDFSGIAKFEGYEYMKKSARYAFGIYATLLEEKRSSFYDSVWKYAFENGDEIDDFESQQYKYGFVQSQLTRQNMIVARRVRLWNRINELWQQKGLMDSIQNFFSGHTAEVQRVLENMKVRNESFGQKQGLSYDLKE